MKSISPAKSLFGLVVALAGSVATAEIQNVLHYKKVRGYNHAAAIEACEQALDNLAAEHEFSVKHSKDHLDIVNASAYDVVVFDNNVWNDGPEGVLPSMESMQALRDYIEDGGAWLGLGAVSDYYDDGEDWDWYRDVLFSGSYYTGDQKGEFTLVADADLVQDPALLAMWQAAGFENTVTFNTVKNRFNQDVHVRDDPDVKVLQKLTQGDSDYEDHVFTWTKPIGQGRMLYTALGHGDDINDFIQNDKWLERAIWHWMQYLDGQYGAAVSLRAEGGRLRLHRVTDTETARSRFYALTGRLAGARVGRTSPGLVLFGKAGPVIRIEN